MTDTEILVLCKSMQEWIAKLQDRVDQLEREFEKLPGKERSFYIPIPDDTGCKEGICIP